MTDPRWPAVLARDRTADGRFVYAVASTRVFCRPSCPARRPDPNRVRFFESPDDAAEAGYRACRRCRPEALATEHDAVVVAAALVRDHPDASLPLAELAARVGLSPSHLQRRFVAVMGASPAAYARRLRLDRLKKGLREGEPVLDAGFDAGFGAASRTHAAADAGLGMTPAAYRTGGGGETIGYARGETRFGPLLIGATARGLCFVQFDADVPALQAEFPRATLVPVAGAPLDAWLGAIAAFLADAAPSPELPLDLRGTALQLRVWRLLTAVRAGERLSYAELAARAGAPTAVRAVASACARNRVALLVPCHRVLRGDGGLGGFRWGLDRKQALLDWEGGA